MPNKRSVEDRERIMGIFVVMSIHFSRFPYKSTIALLPVARKILCPIPVCSYIMIHRRTTGKARATQITFRITKSGIGKIRRHPLQVRFQELGRIYSRIDPRIVRMECFFFRELLEI